MAFDFAAKVRALLATADSLEAQGNDAAAQSYRDKANLVMREYQVAEEEALAQDPASATPIRSKVTILSRDTELSGWYRSIFHRIADHCGVRFVTDWEDGTQVAHVVGYEGDVRYAEYLWTGAYLMFSTKIDPVWSADRSEAENIYLLRNAGIERRKIADKAWGNGREAAARSKVQRIYLKECARRGEEARATGLSHQTEVYRRAYAQSFVTTFGRRLQMAADATDAATGGVVLHGRADRVDEAFYGHFPYMRPRPRTETVVVVNTEGECEACKKTKSKTGKCKDHRPMTWTQRDEARYQRFTSSPSARAGQESGRVAAEGVHLTRGPEKAQRVERGGHAIEG